MHTRPTEKKPIKKKEEITNITTTNGKFNYAYSNSKQGNILLLLTAKEADNHYYNDKNMSLKVIE